MLNIRTSSFILFALLLAFASITLAETNDDITPQYECEVDADCVSVPDGCCDCFSGGKATAVNLSWEGDWLDNLKIQCEDVMCAMVISDHWTCQAQPACVEGRCQLIVDVD